MVGIECDEWCKCEFLAWAHFNGGGSAPRIWCDGDNIGLRRVDGKLASQTCFESNQRKQAEQPKK